MPSKTSRITKDPETGRLMLDGQLLERNDPRLWGSAGNIAAFGIQPQRVGVDDAQSMARFVDNPYYVRGPDEVDSEGGGTYATFTIKPEIAERLAGRVQLGQSGVGGYDELREDVDVGSLEYDDEFGILVRPEQIGESDRGRGRQLRNIALAGMALMGGAAALEAAGAFGGQAAGVNVGLDAFEAGSFASGGAGEATTLANSVIPEVTTGATSAATSGLPGSATAGPNAATWGADSAIINGTAAPVAGTGSGVSLATGSAPTGLITGSATGAAGSSIPSWVSEGLRSPFAQRLAAGAITGAASNYFAGQRQEDQQRATEEENQRQRDFIAEQRRVDPGTWTATTRQIYASGLPYGGGLIRSNMNRGTG